MYITVIYRRFSTKTPAISPPLLQLFSPSLRSLSTSSTPIISTVHHLNPSLDPAIVRSNLQITKLSREGKIFEARQLFDETPDRDLITWSALISGYIRCGHLREARHLFDRPDAKKNVVTWTALLSGYIRSNRIQEAEALFYQIPDKNVVTYNTMIEGLSCGLFGGKARDCVRWKMPHEKCVSWNAGLSQKGRVDEAYDLFCKMGERDVISWTAMVTGLAQNGKIDLAREVFDKMPDRNVVSWNAMISGYSANKRIEEALELFERMPKRDIPSWNAIITGLIQNTKLDRARKLFDEMTERNVVTWTSLITGYVQNGKNEIALKLFLEMLADGIKPNEGTFVNILPAVGNLAILQEGQLVHQMIMKTPFQFKPFIDACLISMYSKCGEIGIAKEVFNLSKRKDLVSWNAIIAAFSHHGRANEAVQWFEDMQRKGFKPNDVTYIELLSACSHSGLVDEGLMFFKSMVRDESVQIREDHYTCLVDLCSRAGRIEEAMNLIKGLKIKPPALVWGALLGGCNNHGNVKIADLAAKRLLEAEPDNAGTYTLLSNVYASAGKWEEAKKIRSTMRSRGLKKQPGCSWIEIGSMVHVFLVQDKSHSERELIYSMVRNLHHQMRMAEHIPSLDNCSVKDADFVVL
ncbi:LOW QUALITY PROTEIN: pentatricopeptide repeat-containing protein At2g35030, mitochondrial-like [Asparagus officinalis]|uniref:LOW QUALITY PROTEIN: pentatricopeptide repeat-containing protein At2g35030, mitochondrial-like n=1 Tax=Asparagus officinalis TaxID=4686 RepID=UPI00098E237E|nr:LOW QUALITY PROTEIN: pentatricopeptide repeat-containing protein At2g35030, mitochondrial-like [Asparagus officinalis]